MSDEQVPNYNLTLTARQAAVIQAALELYSRVGMAQYGSIVDHPDVMKAIIARPYGTVNTVHEPMDELKARLHNLPVNGYYGIGSQHIDESNRVAYDIQQVIRHRLSHDRADAEGVTERWQFSFDTPMQTSKHSLATFVKS